MDLREPNKAVLDTAVPLPRAKDIRAELHGCKTFSKLDFKTGFHQLELDGDFRYLTVFSHKGKLERHTRLTMRATPASGELNKVLRLLSAHLPTVPIKHDDLVIETETVTKQESMILSRAFQVDTPVSAGVCLTTRSSL